LYKTKIIITTLIKSIFYLLGACYVGYL